MSAPCPLFGATVRAELRPHADTDALVARFHALLASRGLVATGGSGSTWDLVVSSEAGQMTDGDRSAIVQWLEGEREVERATVSPLGDLR